MVMAGMVSIFVAGKQHVMHSRDRMTSSEIGKFFLEPLGLAVSQSTWDTGALSEGAHSGTTQKINNIDYTAPYAVSSLDGARPDAPRRVVATVHWTEN